jgi:hypothetical protein
MTHPVTQLNWAFSRSPAVPLRQKLLRDQISRTSVRQHLNGENSPLARLDQLRQPLRYQLITALGDVLIAQCHPRCCMA